MPHQKCALHWCTSEERGNGTSTQSALRLYASRCDTRDGDNAIFPMQSCNRLHRCTHAPILSMYLCPINAPSKAPSRPHPNPNREGPSTAMATAPSRAPIHSPSTHPPTNWPTQGQMKKNRPWVPSAPSQFFLCIGTTNHPCTHPAAPTRDHAFTQTTPNEQILSHPLRCHGTTIDLLWLPLSSAQPSSSGSCSMIQFLDDADKCEKSTLQFISSRLQCPLCLLPYHVHALYTLHAPHPCQSIISTRI